MMGLTVVEVHQTGSTLAGYATILALNLLNAPITGTVNGSAISFGDVNHVVQYDGTFTGPTSASGTFHANRWGGIDGTWGVTQVMPPFDDTAPAFQIGGIWSQVCTSSKASGQFQSAVQLVQTGSALTRPPIAAFEEPRGMVGRVSGTKAWLMVDPATGEPFVFAGDVASQYAVSGKCMAYDITGATGIPDTGAWDASVSVVVAGAAPGDSTTNLAKLSGPTGVTVDASGNLFVADTQDDTIRQITPAGDVTTLAGTAGESGSADGKGSAARFSHPTGVAVSASGNLYVVDSLNQSLRKIVISTGEVTTLPRDEYYAPSGVAVDASGNIYEVSRLSYTVRRFAPSGAMTTLAGTEKVSGNALTIDPLGNLYVADAIHDVIFRITPTGDVTTLAGEAGQSGADDGTGASARFDNPGAVALDSLGNLYVADSQNKAIRKITPAGVVTTILHIGVAPVGVALDGAGSLFFVVDSAILRTRRQST